MINATELVQEYSALQKQLLFQIKQMHSAAPVTQANATGIIERGENSNNNNSIANKTAAIGVPNIAAMPAVAPAANITFLSLGVIFIICPATEPNAPPVAIIGPSAPKVRRCL